MVERLVLAVVDRMEAENISSGNMHEEYIYALTGMLEKWITLLSVVLLAAFLGQLKLTLIFMMFFLTLRKRTGGFHAEHFYQCYLGTLAVVAAMTYIYPLAAEHINITYEVLAIAIAVITVIGTVNHPNIDMSSDELKESRKAARWLLAIEIMVIAMSLMINIDKLYISSMAVAIILCAILMGLAKIFKQEVKTDEKN